MIPRTVYPQILKSIEDKPVTLITGARQTGKTYLCREISESKGIKYVTLADRQERILAQKDPDAFLSIHGVPLIIDEIQKAPELFDSIESIVDKAIFERKNDKGMYIIAGSQTYRLMNGVSESLAGRVGIIRMSTLSISEIIERENIPFTPDIHLASERSLKEDVATIYADIYRGNYPELHSNHGLRAHIFYSDYVDTYIAQDVMELINLKDQNRFFGFMQILASMTGQELVESTLCNATGINSRTLKEWMSVLEAGEIIRLLQPYNGASIVKRVTKRPKIYFRDTGLACYLAKITDPKTLMASYLKGPMAETYIVNEIIKTYENQRENAAFYYYRSSDGNEVDLLIQRNGEINLIECKGGIDVGASDVRSFSRLGDTKDRVGPSCVICMTERPYPVKDEIYAIPVTSI